ECLPACEVACTQPYACSRSLEPCVTSCGDSRAVVYAPPVVLTFPGPALASCSQESIVGTSIPQPYGAGIQYGSEESYGMGSSVGMSGNWGSFGARGVLGVGGSFGARSSFG
ncbi:KRFA protein, partial [Penelope pileata]|nr:KRFA protein [Penelope pileata]